MLRSGDRELGGFLGGVAVGGVGAVGAVGGVGVCLEDAGQRGGWFVEGTDELGAGGEENAEQLSLELWFAWQIGEDVGGGFIDEVAIDQASAEREAFTFFIESFEDLGGGGHVFGAGDDGALTEQAFDDFFREAGLFSGEADERVFGNRHFGADFTKPFTGFIELGDGGFSIVNDEDEWRLIQTRVQFVDDDFFDRIHWRGAPK